MHPYRDIWLLLLAGLGTLYVIPGRATGVYFHLDELIRYEGLNFILLINEMQPSAKILMSHSWLLV